MLAAFVLATHLPVMRMNLGMAYFNLGNRYREREEWSQAIEQYKRALEVDRDYAPTYNNLALAYEDSGEHLHEAILTWGFLLKFANQHGLEKYSERASRHLRELGAEPSPEQHPEDE